MVLVVVTGRSDGVKYIKRLCELCSLGKLRDEYNYLLRQKHLLVYFRLSPNVYKMTKLFITKDTVILRKLAKLGKEIVSVFGHV